MKKKFVVRANSNSSRRQYVVSSEAFKEGVTPPWLTKWYYQGHPLDAENAGFGIGTLNEQRRARVYRDEGLEYKGTIIAKPEFIDLLDDAYLGMLDVIVHPETGELVAVTIARDGVSEIEMKDIHRALTGEVID